MVPEGWRSLPLGDMLERITNGLVYNPRQTEGVRVTRIETISDARIDVSKVGFTEYSPAMEQYRLQRGDILYSHINSLKHIGKVAFFDSEEVLYHGMNLLLLRANNSVLPKYLYYLLDSSVGQRYAHTYAKSAVNQASINIAELRQFHFKVPPLYEQEHIIEILQTWDTSIAQTQALIAATRERKRGLMQVLLTGKKRFKEFRDSWSTQPLATHLRSRQKGRPIEINSEGKGWPYIGSTAFDGSYANYTDDPKAILCEPQDVLLLWDGEYAGKSSTGHKGAVGSTVMALKLEPTLDNTFLDNLLQFYNPQIRAVREGSGIPHMPGDFFEWFKPSLPTIAEQRKIASVLSAADAEIMNLEQQLEAYKLQKRGLMQQLLTGKKRVKVDELEAVV